MKGLNLKVGNYVHVNRRNSSVRDFALIIKEGDELKVLSIIDQKKYQLEEIHPIMLTSQIIERLELEEVKFTFQVRYKNEYEMLYSKFWLKDVNFALLPIYNIKKYKEGGFSFSPLIITDSRILKEGIDWDKIEEYEKDGIVKSFKFVHELQNHMSENRDLGEIDFTKIISLNKK
jgi:hypothetical protein